MNHWSRQPLIIKANEIIKKDPLWNAYGFKIYSLSHDAQIFYIGCTSRFLNNRLWAHMSAARNNYPHPLYIKIREILKMGDVPAIATLELVAGNKKIAYHKEQGWIKKLETEGIRLLNKQKFYL